MRWISRDPAGCIDSKNLYALGWGNPIGATDPFGLSAGFAGNAAPARGVSIEDGDDSFIGFDDFRLYYTSDWQVLRYWRSRSVGHFWAYERGWFSGYHHGAWHGLIMALDNLSVGLIPGLHEYADEIRRLNSGNPWYTAGDWSSFIGSILFPPGLLFKGFRIVRPAIVIGETMRRVKWVAFWRGAGYYGGAPKHFLEINKWAHNIVWLKSKLRAGYRVIDIGLDLKRRKRSIPYWIEDRIRRMYDPRYIRS